MWAETRADHRGGIPLAGQIRRLGGFAGLNSGSITDSYSDLRLRQGKGRVLGGFAGENQGELLRCVRQSLWIPTANGN